jgi:hypothetical protein
MYDNITARTGSRNKSGRVASISFCFGWGTPDSPPRVPQPRNTPRFQFAHGVHSPVMPSGLSTRMATFRRGSAPAPWSLEYDIRCYRVLAVLVQYLEYYRIWEQ